MPDEPRGAYVGAASDAIEAERFADAVAEVIEGMIQYGR